MDLVTLALNHVLIGSTGETGDLLAGPSSASQRRGADDFRNDGLYSIICDKMPAKSGHYDDLSSPRNTNNVTFESHRLPP